MFEYINSSFLEFLVCRLSHVLLHTSKFVYKMLQSASALANAAARRGGAASASACRLGSMRPFSMFPSMGAMYSRGGFTDVWPQSSANTVLNVCPAGSCMVIERLGKFHRVQQPGLFLALPWVDRIAYVVDMREKAMEIEPQPAITKDNVSVDVSGNVFVKFFDPERAAYGSFNPLYAMRQNAQASMRAAIGRMELDEILHARAELNARVTEDLSEAAQPWGLDIMRYEITEISPDQEIQIAMDKQAVAERDRREQVLAAEGLKRSEVLKSEGVKMRLQNESEGDLIRVKNEAEAEKFKLLMEAEGEAQATLAKAKAQAEAIRIVGEAVETAAEKLQSWTSQTSSTCTGNGIHVEYADDDESRAPGMCGSSSRRQLLFSTAQRNQATKSEQYLRLRKRKSTFNYR